MFALTDYDLEVVIYILDIIFTTTDIASSFCVRNSCVAEELSSVMMLGR